MEGTITYGIDTDTEKVDIKGYTKPQSVRTWGIDSPESKSSVDRKNTEEGMWSSSMTKAIVRKGDVLTIDTPTERDVFGRIVSKSSKKFNDKTVDLGFLKASLGLAAYYTDKGVDVTSEDHKMLKETYDTRLPFQFSDGLEPLEEDKFLEVGTNIMKLNTAMNKNKNGIDNQAEIDTLVAQMYGDGEDQNIAKYLAMKKRLLMNRDWESEPMTADKIIYQAFQNPKMQEQWDQAVRNKAGQQKAKQSWEDTKPTWQEKVSASADMFSIVAQFVDYDALFQASKSELKVTDELLGEEIAKLPLTLQSSVYDKAGKLGNEAALMYAVQTQKDVESHDIFDNMPIMAQFVWGAGGTIVDPIALGTGILTAGKAVLATKAIRTWAVNPVLKALSYTGTWAAASGIESTVVNTPKLIGDHTYTPGDLLLDMALDTTIGTVLPISVIGAKYLKPKVTKYFAERAEIKKNAPEQLAEELRNEQTRGQGTTEERMDTSLAGRKKRDRPVAGSKKGAENNGEVDTTGKSDTRPTNTDSSSTDSSVDEVVTLGDRPTTQTPDGKNTSTGESDVEATIVDFEEVPVINETPWTSGQERARVRQAAREESGEGTWTQKEIDHMESKDRAEDVVESWNDSGLAKDHKAATKPASLWEKGTSGFANLTGKVTSHVMQMSNNKVFSYFGFNMLEDPKGFAGRVRRGDTASKISVREREKMLSQIMPEYNIHMENYWKSKGAMEHQKFRAKWESSEGNKMAKEFEDAVIDAINDRKMGRKVARHESVEAMADAHDKFFKYAHARAVDEGLPGWAGRIRKHYFPQMHAKTAMRNHMKKFAVNEQGAKDLEMMFTKGMMSAREAGLHNLPDAELRRIAKDIVKGAELPTGALPDSQANALARARTRVEMDWSVEHNGLKLRDFLETNIPKVTNRYASDVSGRLALTKVTRGKISTDLDITTLKELAQEEHQRLIKVLEEKGDTKGIEQLKKSFKKESQIFDDEISSILGRPTGGGLAPELRNFKRLNMLTRMGILGTSQAIETGNAIARSTLDLFSDRTALKHLFAMSKDSVENKALLDDIMNITGRTKDAEYLVRPEAVLDEASMKELGNIRQLSVWASDKLTGGRLKESATRALGSTSMFNYVMRKQSGVIQKSLLTQVDKYFTTGKSAIHPKRMIDLGFINLDGTDVDLSRVFNEVVKRNEHGHIIDLQWDKWGKKAQEKYMNAAQRDEAQNLQRTFGGETPGYYNNPLLNLLFQFREVPLVAQQKQLARHASFADKEAMTSVMLNIATAGLVRFSWVAGLGFAKHKIEGKDSEDFTLPGLRRLDLQRYLASGGMVFDGLEIAGDMWEGVERKDPGRFFKPIPQSGLVKDAIDFATGNDKVNTRVEAVQGLTMLGNTWYMDALHTMLIKQVDERAKKYND